MPPDSAQVPPDPFRATPRPSPGALGPLAEIEAALTACANGYHRWLLRGMAAAGAPPMSPLEIVILARLGSEAAPRRFADLCRALGTEDVHQVRYALRKLAAAGLVAIAKMGKERVVRATEQGARIAADFHDLRDRLLTLPVHEAAQTADLAQAARGLRALAGAYDRAAGAAVGW